MDGRAFHRRPSSNARCSAYDAINAVLPFAIDPGKITVEPGLSYTRDAIKAHDYTVGVLSALGSVADRLGAIRGRPAQTMKLNRRRSGSS